MNIFICYVLIFHIYSEKTKWKQSKLRVLIAHVKNKIVILWKHTDTNYKLDAISFLYRYFITFVNHKWFYK